MPSWAGERTNVLRLIDIKTIIGATLSRDYLGSLDVPTYKSSSSA